jgi:hypothetical protein
MVRCPASYAETPVHEHILFTANSPLCVSFLRNNGQIKREWSNYVTDSGSIVDTTSFASFLPFVDGAEIHRDNIVQTLETMLDARNVLSVHLEGPLGSGKSVLLGQFAKRNHKRTISLFVKRGSWFTSDPDFLFQGLAAQINWLVSRNELRLGREVDDALMRRLVYQLRSYSARIAQPIVLVVDGLDEIPESERELKAALVRRLPLGLDYIKLLTSSNAGVFGIVERSKEWLLPMFSIEETLNYFDGLLSTECIRVIHATCNGSPGFLASIKRLIGSGGDEQTLLSELPSTLPDIFALEWRSVDESDLVVTQALSLLAHDSYSHSLNELADLFSCDPNVLRTLLSALRFLIVPPNDHEPLAFVSDPFRRFAANKLAGHRDSVIQIMIERLSKDENSASAVSLLPSYLRQAQQSARLLQYLSPDRFAKLLDHSHQISPVKQKVLLGLETATEAGNYSEMLRFAVQASALAEYSGFTVSRSEIIARMELEDLASCISLAQAAVLLNDRLRLFSAIGRIRRERGESLEPEFIKELESLFERAEWKEFNGDNLNQLAADLVYIRPELATSALERASEQGVNRTGRLDMALATASMLAERSQDKEVLANADSVRSRISNPRILAMLNALSALMRHIDSDEVLRRVREIDAPKDQLFLLRQWSLHARTTEGVFAVASYALDLAIKTTEYTPTATDFRELAEVFRRLNPSEQILNLVHRFDAQRAAVEKIGPTTDFVYLQLLLTLGESRIDVRAAGNRLVDIFGTVSQISDFATKAGCLARLIDMLPLIDPTGNIRAREGIETLSLEDFESTVTELLGSTADHKSATREIIGALAPRNPAAAMKLAKSLNTAPRRDDALSWLMERILSLDDEQIDLSCLEALCDSFYDQCEAEEVVTNVLERLSRISKRDTLLLHKASILKSTARVLKFRNPRLKVKAICAARLSLYTLDDRTLSDLVKDLDKRLEDAWELLDVNDEKVNLAFEVSAKLAKKDRQGAIAWLRRAEACRTASPIAVSSDSYRHCLLLVCRAYGGMVKRHLDDPEDLLELERLIRRIPSSGEKLGVWTDVALRLLALGRMNEARSIGTDFIQKLIAEFRPDTTDRFRAICTAAPLLYQVSKAMCLDLISELPPTWKDAAVGLISDFICKKLAPWEPYEAFHHQAYALTLDEMKSLCELVDICDSDVLAYWIMSKITAALLSKGARKELTGNQRADVIAGLRKIAADKFPNPNYITHMGFSVLSSAEIAQLERFKQSEWEKIVGDASAIGNIADRCLVLGYIASRIGKSDRNWALRLFAQCESDAERIPSVLDRAGRFGALACESYSVDRELSRRLYLKALIMTSDESDSEYDKARRDIIDSAYLISHELATSLASAMDGDEARRAQRGISGRMEILDLRRQIVEAKFDKEPFPEKAKTRLSQASWEILGSLNSGRVVPLKVHQTSKCVECASSLPFESAFPIYSFVIENAILRSQDKSDSLKVIRGGFKALLMAADLFYFLAERSTLFSGRMTEQRGRESDDFCIVEAGGRNVAGSFIERWLAKAESSTLNISDPYFTPADAVEVLKMVLLVNPTLEVNIVTSKRGLQSAHVGQPFKDSFQQAWSASSSQSAPVTRIIVVDVGNQGDPLIHDRWWATGDSALEFGSSFNALGTAKQTKISVMGTAESTTVSQRLSEQVRMGVRYVEGRRVVCESFEIS